MSLGELVLSQHFIPLPFLSSSGAGTVPHTSSNLVISGGAVNNCINATVASGEATVVDFLSVYPNHLASLLIMPSVQSASKPPKLSILLVRCFSRPSTRPCKTPISFGRSVQSLSSACWTWVWTTYVNRSITSSSNAVV